MSLNGSPTSDFPGAPCTPYSVQLTVKLCPTDCPSRDFDSGILDVRYSSSTSFDAQSLSFARLDRGKSGELQHLSTLWTRAWPVVSWWAWVGLSPVPCGQGIQGWGRCNAIFLHPAHPSLFRLARLVVHQLCCIFGCSKVCMTMVRWPEPRWCHRARKTLVRDVVPRPLDQHDPTQSTCACGPYQAQGSPLPLHATVISRR